MARSSIVEGLIGNHFLVLEVEQGEGLGARIGGSLLNLGLNLMGLYSYSNISGIEWQLETIEWESVNRSGSYVTVGDLENMEVTFTRPLYLWDNVFWSWLNDFRLGLGVRKDLVVILLKKISVSGYIGAVGNGEEFLDFVDIDIQRLMDFGVIPVRGWYLQDCVPIGLSGYELDASASDVIMNELSVDVRSGFEVTLFDKI